jgi:hypothetical protein
MEMKTYAYSFLMSAVMKIKDDIVGVFNEMCMDDNITEQQKNGLIVCVPKAIGPIAPAE